MLNSYHGRLVSSIFKVGWTSSRMGKDKFHTQFLWGKVLERNQSNNVEIKG